MADEIITFNVGGKIFQTMRSTITNTEPDSMLSTMISGKIDTTKDSQGNYFIDRNYEYFKYILNYFRTHKMPSINSEFLEEIKYFNLKNLLDSLEKLEVGKKRRKNVECLTVDVLESIENEAKNENKPMLYLRKNYFNKPNLISLISNCMKLYSVKIVLLEDDAFEKVAIDTCLANNHNISKFAVVYIDELKKKIFVKDHSYVKNLMFSKFLD